MAEVSEHDQPIAGDDAKNAVFSVENLPDHIAFDHRRILDDYIRSRKSRSA